MTCDFEAMFGEIVGKGAQATVYAKGEYAVKLYREGYPKRVVFAEAYVMVNLELACLSTASDSANAGFA